MQNLDVTFTSLIDYITKHNFQITIIHKFVETSSDKNQATSLNFGGHKSLI